MDYRRNGISWAELNNNRWSNSRWAKTSDRLKDLEVASIKERRNYIDSLTAAVETIMRNDVLLGRKNDYSSIRGSMSRLSWDDFIDSYELNDYSKEDLATLYKRYKAVQRSYKRVKKLEKQIKYVKNISASVLRDLREFFTVTHSFHFKNLDDYHSLASVNAC